MILKSKCALMQRREENTWNEICIVPHSICKLRCGFCFLNKEAVGPVDWKALFLNIYSFCEGYDFSSGYTTMRAFGGELFMDCLIEDPEYKKNLTKVFELMSYYTRNNGCLEIPVSTENIGPIGVAYIKELMSKFEKMKVIVPFSIGRLVTEDAIQTYWDSLKALAPVSRIGILITGSDDGYKKYIPELEKYGKISYEEPVMLDNFHFSYADTYLPEATFSGIRCVSNYIRFITPKGVFTCAGVTKRPYWIDELEWKKLEDDFNYLNEGYQKVIEWYGCDVCDKQETCPGMCWKTYYAQKELYNNHKCLYKDKL